MQTLTRLELPWCQVSDCEHVFAQKHPAKRSGHCSRRMRWTVDTLDPHEVWRSRTCPEHSWQWNFRSGQGLVLFIACWIQISCQEFRNWSCQFISEKKHGPHRKLGRMIQRVEGNMFLLSSHCFSTQCVPGTKGSLLRPCPQAKGKAGTLKVNESDVLQHVPVFVEKPFLKQGLKPWQPLETRHWPTLGLPVELPLYHT